MQNILSYIQIVLSILLIISIVLQQSGSGTGGAFGGDNLGSFHHTKRGFEKFLFYFTIITAILFAISAFLAVII